MQEDLKKIRHVISDIVNEFFFNILQDFILTLI